MGYTGARAVDPDGLSKSGAGRRLWNASGHGYKITDFAEREMGKWGNGEADIFMQACATGCVRL